MHNKNNKPFSILRQLERGVELQDCWWADWLVADRLASRDTHKDKVSKQLNLNLILTFLPHHTPRLQ
jgi:hypothetical protein